MGLPGVMGEPTRVEDEVVEACRQGDRDAMRIVFETYKDRVYSIALCFFDGDEAAAKDVTQQVFLKLLTRMEQFGGRAGFATWLYRLVVNACIDRRRSGRLLVFLADLAGRHPAAQRQSQEQDYIRGEVEASVRSEIARLSPKLRLPILLRYFDDLSYEEIAQALDCSPGTVASRLNRGHKILARRLTHLREAGFRGV